MERTPAIIRTRRRDASRWAPRDEAYQLRIFTNPLRQSPTPLQLIDRYYADLQTPGSSYMELGFFPPFYVQGWDPIPDTMHAQLYRLRKVPLGEDIPGPPPTTSTAAQDPGWDGTFMIVRGWRMSSFNMASVMSVESLTISRGGGDFLAADSERQSFVGLQLPDVPASQNMKDNYFPVIASSGAWSTATTVLVAASAYHRVASSSIVDRDPAYPGIGATVPRLTQLLVEITRYPEAYRDPRLIPVREVKPVG